MTIAKSEVEHVAYLARIKLDEKEIEHFTAQLEFILEYIDKLKKVDIRRVEPTSHVLPIRNILRSDTTTPPLAVREVLQNAPDKEESFFKVPRIIVEK